MKKVRLERRIKMLEKGYVVSDKNLYQQQDELFDFVKEYDWESLEKGEGGPEAEVGVFESIMTLFVYSRFNRNVQEDEPISYV